MARSSGSGRKSRKRSPKEPQLSGLLHRRLNAYALAASATGAALLALSPPSEAEIVYTPANSVISRNGSYRLDLNNDGIVDFTIVEFAKGSSLRSTQSLSVIPERQNQVMCGWVACTSGFSGAAAADFGNKIGTAQYAWLPFPRDNMARAFNSPGFLFSSGSWAHIFQNRARYLGLKFQVDGETHFGWARLNVRFKQTSLRTWQARLTGYAYETIPNKPIIAGQTTGPNDDAAAHPNSTLPVRPTSVQRQPPPASPRFATLGALALGVDGIALWRREDQSGDYRED